MDTLKRQVKSYAREMGFDLVGIASPESFADHESITLERLRAGLMDGLPLVYGVQGAAGLQTRRSFSPALGLS